MYSAMRLLTNLSIYFQNFKTLQYRYMRVKYKTVINIYIKHFFDDSLPLDDEMELKGWGFQHQRNEHNIIFLYPHRKCTNLYIY